MDEFLYRSPVFSVQALKDAFPFESESALYKRLRHLASSGKVVSVLKGVYAVLPPGTNSQTFTPDPFLVLTALRPDATFCGHSALDLQGVGNQVWSRLTAYSKAKSTKVHSRGREYVTFRPPAWLEECWTTFDRMGTFVRVTNPELTLVEGFRYPNRVGGIEELVKSAEGFRKFNLDNLLMLLERLAMRKLYAAVGWFLSQDADHWKADSTFLDELRSMRPSSPKYLEHGSRGSVLDSEWNILIPRSVARSKMTDGFGANDEF